jgi:uncharacterized membrane protein YeiB
MTTLFGCCSGFKSKWYFERAPEPSDIYWENLNTTKCQRIFRTMLAYIITLALFGLGTFIIFTVKVFQIAKMKEDAAIEKKEMTIEQLNMHDLEEHLRQRRAQIISIYCSLMISILNYVFAITFRKISLREGHETQTKMSVSVAIKLTFARFLNTSLILVITNFDAKFWFKDGSLVYDATVLILFMAFLNPIMYLIDPWTLYK